MKQNIYEFILNELENEKPVLFATIFKRSGSSPRGAGAFMVLSQDDRMMGTIGGGKVEAAIRENLGNYLTKSQSQIIQFFLSESDAADLDMICGGNVSVLVESIFPNQTVLIKMLAVMKETSQNQTNGWLVSHVPSPEAREGLGVKKAFILPEGTVTGNWDIKVEVKDQQLVSITLPEGNQIDTQDLKINRQAQLIKNCFIEPIGQFSKVFLIGAGHVAQKLALITPTVGFKTIVLDDRAEYVSKERFPFADLLIVLPDFKSVFSGLTIDTDSYLVIVTRGHSSDKEVLSQALRTEAGYIGMIGSKRKIRTTFDLLKQEGVTQEALNRVHTPIGLSIGAETPEEITISIVAELIQERAKMKDLKNR
jgi:xanthine dehydrogenase accessory factor